MAMREFFGTNNPAFLAERSERSVFVGNIPYEATEDSLREIFAQVGPVLKFRLVQDRDSGKPKGYGFCEYQDSETAQSAMRNLNNYDYHGRSLRVSEAQGDIQFKDEMKPQAIPPQFESPYGNPVKADEAPEAISKAVASLPPEQMFELMKQMKTCIQNNPNEARTMLIQNPQLAYALLQAQIVMKIIDPKVALAMLHRKSDNIPPILRRGDEIPSSSIPSVRTTDILTQSSAKHPATLTSRNFNEGYPIVSQESRDPRRNLIEDPRRAAVPNKSDSRSAGPISNDPRAIRVPNKPISHDAAIPQESDEKTQLIMQVLQLTDEQIAMLPPEQKRSILILREEIAKKSGGVA